MTSSPALELAELRSGAGELVREPVMEIAQPGDAGLARIGLPARGSGGRPPLLELVLEMAPGPVRDAREIPASRASVLTPQAPPGGIWPTSCQPVPGGASRCRAVPA
ncbi:hypothetical protein AB0D27_30820, partial [Streptomyces sp. NPDC048415]|uniref:hypothetical protein n=1 Tax=Streptomyces sp. NPDC048415 TaxID=3154822 RepID=UPI0034435355